MKRFSKIKEYLGQVVLGVRNIHFFRTSSLPKLIRAFSPLEKKLTLVSLVAALTCGSFLVSASYLNSTVEKPGFGGRYTEGLVGQPRYINPLLSVTNEVDADLARVVYSGLYKFDNLGQLTPDLAASLPEISADQKQYTIKLRPSVTWHDGKPFSADDVVFTFRLAQNPAYQSPLRLNWNKVDIQKLDDLTVRLALKEPAAPFVANLTLGILPQHIWSSVEPGNFSLSKYNQQPIGTGPFMVKQVKKAEAGDIKSILLGAFPNYLPKRPFLSEVEFKFYQSYDDLIAAYHGRDVMGLGYIPFDKKIYVQISSSINLYSLALPRYQAVFFNPSKSAVLADKNVRAALAQSLNREVIIDQVYAGAARPAYGPIPAGSLGYNPGVEKANLFDLENAKKLLANSGFAATGTDPVLVKTGKTGSTKLEFTLTTDNFPANVQTAELLRQQWENTGFKIDLQILTLGELQRNYLHPRAYEALLFAESVGADPDPYPYWHSSQARDPGLNLAMYSNKETDQLLLDARANADPNYRIPRYQRFQELVANDVPAVFIVNSLYVYGVSTRVRGINLSSITNPAERFLDIGSWYIKTKRVWK